MIFWAFSLITSLTWVARGQLPISHLLAGSMYTWQKRPVAIREVVEHVRRVKSTVTVTIRTLERHGYVRKSPSETDARVTYVELTAKGRGLQKDFEEISEMLRSRLYGDMSEKDRERLVKQLDGIEENLSQ